MTNNKNSVTAYLIALFALICACSPQNNTVIKGNIDYIGDSDFYLETIPLHYKYSEKSQIPLEVSNSEFTSSLKISEAQIIYLGIQDEKYPIYAVPGETVTLDIMRADFPKKCDRARIRGRS